MLRSIEVRLPTGEVFEQIEYWPYTSFAAGPLKVTQVLCSDGKRRTVRCSSLGADTFFSIPSKVSVEGKTVSGFLTRESLAGFTTASELDPAVWKFVAYPYGKNAGLLPRGAYRVSPGGIPTDSH